MDEWLRSASAVLIPSLVVAVVTAFVTVRLSLRRFHAERWWERKADAYSQIVESLYHLKVYSDTSIRESREGVQYTAEHKKALTEQYSAAHAELSKTTTIGAYIICDEAAKVLEELQNRPELDWNETPPWDIFEADSTAYGEAIKKIRNIAKMDLGVS